MKKSKTRIIVAAVLSVVLLVGAIISIVAVLAAQTQNISSNITIGYTVDGVGAKVSAKYGIIPDNSASATLTAMTTSDGNTTELLFKVSDSQTQGALTPNGDISLTQEAGTSVIFEYRFENMAEMPFAIGLETRETGTTKNIAEKYYFSRTELPTSEYGRVEYENFAVQALDYKEVIYIYIKVSVENINHSAAYNKSYNWEIHQAVGERVEITLNNGTGTGGLASVQAVAGTAVPILSALPTATSGAVFTGYFDAATNGTQYISNTGAGIKEIAGAMTLYAQYKTVASVSTTGENTTIANTSDEELYVPTSEGTTFNYGGTDYTSNGEYLLLNPDQTVTMTNAASASYADSANTISTLRPLDIAEKKFYSAYGEYPQTYVGNTLNETLKGLADSAKTGKRYTTDINGTTTYLDEYLHNGKKYAKLISSNFTGNTTTGVTFSTGDTVASSQTYFFIVEPILCKAMEVGNGKATMMSVNLLGSMAFDQDANDWQSSDIREYLNGTFLQESGLAGIAKAVSITNEDLFNTSNYNENTTDQIFLASAEEICKWSGSSYDQFVIKKYLNDENNVKRKILINDMAKATYAYSNSQGYGNYYLRSSGAYSENVCDVNTKGETGSYYDYSSNDLGFSPCFVVEV